MHPPTESLEIRIEQETWSPDKAESLYFVKQWGNDYFSVNEEGHVAVKPIRGSELTVDLHEVVQQLRERGISFPALVRFQDLLKSRVDHLNQAFRAAIERFDYRSSYQGVYPIKVNQLREVVEEILESGAPYEYGLECGSKSELVATIPYLAEYDRLLLCNGSKDRVMYRLMVAGQRLGKRVIPIVERADELDLMFEEAHRGGFTFRFGTRVRLTTRGAGLWSESGGENSKFGISITELMELAERLSLEGCPASLEVIHFHLGSQIADIEHVRKAVQEAARIYAWLRSRGIDVAYFDVGGGLGVSYEAGNPDALGTINYSLDEYAQTVVSTLKTVCDEEGVVHPVIVSESGRAVTAHHSVLIVEAVGSRRKDQPRVSEGDWGTKATFVTLREIFGRAEETSQTVESLGETYAALRRIRGEATEMFRKGSLSLEEKARFERLYWATCILIDRRVRELGSAQLPRPLLDLESQLADHYQCNFSVFRSMVDHWAIGQRFPIMPVQRLNEAPTRRGILVDLTCDSDGKVRTFVSSEGDKRYLELHVLRPDEPYYLGVFLMGAYQDIMGDMHNLFGRVTEAHVYADEDEPGNFYLEEILPGATVEEQLELVQYHANDLERRMGDLIQMEVKGGRVRPKEGVKLLNEYRRVFRNMTYLNTDPEG